MEKISLLLLVTILTICLSACAKPLVYPSTNIQAKPSLHNAYAVAADGYHIPITRWKPSNQVKAIVLALHGLNDYSRAFQDLGVELSGKGIMTIAYDQRGFGTTQGRGRWHSNERLVDDLRTMIKLLRTHYQGTPLYVVGESMGGAVILASLAKEPLDADGLILLAPAIWSRDSMPFYQRVLLWVAAHTMPGKQLTGEGLNLKPSDNAAMLKALSSDPMVIKKTRVDVLYGVTNLMDQASNASLKFSGDTLILYGEHDEIIPKAPTCRMLDRFANDGNHRYQTIIYANGYHMLTRDLQGKKVIGDMAQWILDQKHSNKIDPIHQDMQIALFCEK
jgi:acylglycerol lipase